MGKIGNLKKYNPRLPNRAINVCIVRRTFRHRNDNKRCALVTEQLALTAKCLKQPSAKQLWPASQPNTTCHWLRRLEKKILTIEVEFIDFITFWLLVQAQTGKRLAKLVCFPEMSSFFKNRIARQISWFDTAN